MKIIGITGTSGSGKTTLSKILNEREDVKVVDADKIAKQMSVPGTDYLNAIKDKFGSEILLEDGNLNRKLLASIIYNNDEKRELLNSLTFKYVKDEIVKVINDIDTSVINFAVIDVPLLFESGLDEICDKVISLIADQELKIRRICKRDNIDEETAKSRLNIQNDDEFYISRSDYVIVNKENFDLKTEIDNIFSKIVGEE